MNLIYFGSPDFSAQILESLIKNTPPSSPSPYQGEGRGEVIAVVTTPDKPTGREQITTPSPVASMAQKYDLPVFKPTKLDDTNLAHLKLLKPDIFLTVSYGKIIPQNWLDAPSIGAFNIHFSLLPKYRGALCISETIKNQDLETGVTLLVMDNQLDHGPIISQSKVSIDINDNIATLTKKLTQAAIHLLAGFPPLSLRGGQGVLSSTPQDDSLATYTPPTKSRNRQSAFIPWEHIVGAIHESPTEAPTIHALIRSLNPDPGAWTKINDIEVKIIKTSLIPSPYQGEGQGEVLKIEQVQLPGKSPISWQQFLSGHKIG